MDNAADTQPSGRVPLAYANAALAREATTIHDTYLRQSVRLERLVRKLATKRGAAQRERDRRQAKVRQAQTRKDAAALEEHRDIRLDVPGGQRSRAAAWGQKLLITTIFTTIYFTLAYAFGLDEWDSKFMALALALLEALAGIWTGILLRRRQLGHRTQRQQGLDTGLAILLTGGVMVSTVVSVVPRAQSQGGTSALTVVTLVVIAYVLQVTATMKTDDPVASRVDRTLRSLERAQRSLDAATHRIAGVEGDIRALEDELNRLIRTTLGDYARIRTGVITAYLSKNPDLTVVPELEDPHWIGELDGLAQQSKQGRLFPFDDLGPHRRAS